jgi:hypothetical protein
MPDENRKWNKNIFSLIKYVKGLTGIEIDPVIIQFKNISKRAVGRIVDGNWNKTFIIVFIPENLVTGSAPDAVFGIANNGE